MLRLLALASLTILALPALAVPPQAGDAYLPGASTGRLLIRLVGPGLDDVEVVSCWVDQLGVLPEFCDTPRGGGTTDFFMLGNAQMQAGPDGWL